MPQIDPDISYTVGLQVAKEDFVAGPPAGLAVPAGAVLFNITVYWPTVGPVFRRHPDALIEENSAWPRTLVPTPVLQPADG